jgi:hypothetical protein
METWKRVNEVGRSFMNEAKEFMNKGRGLLFIRVEEFYEQG